MRYTLPSIVTILTLHLCAFSAQAQDILWEKSYGGKHAEFLFDAIPTPDYGFILAGSSISNKNGNKSDNNKGDLDYWVWKMKENGDLDWQKSFGSDGVDLLQSIKLTNDGGFVLAGTSSPNPSKGGISSPQPSPKERESGANNADKKSVGFGDSDFWIIKLDAKGGEMWQKTIGGSGQEKLQSIAKTSDGGYIVGGSSSSSPDPSKGGETGADNVTGEQKTDNPYAKNEDSRGNLDYWVVKLDSKGTVQWQKTIGGLYVDELKSIAQTKDGGYILGGYSNSPVSGEKSENNIGVGDYWIVKLDKEGNIEWQRTIGGDQDDNLFTLMQTKDNGYIVGGNSNSEANNSKSKSNGNGSDFWVLKLDEKGNTAWQETYNYGKTDVLTSIVENADGSYLIGGYAQGEQSQIAEGSLQKALGVSGDKEGINDYIALKINANGEKIWDKTFGSKGDEVLKKLFETRDGGYLLAGTSGGDTSGDKSSSIGGTDFWVVKLKDTSKPDKEKVTVEAVPNPAISYTNVIVNFDYKTGTSRLYDLSGRLINETTISGEHTIPVDLNNLPQGIYIVDIRTDVGVGQHGVKVIKN
jgi:Secretion system C-terminal sorting domain